MQYTSLCSDKFPRRSHGQDIPMMASCVSRSTVCSFAPTVLYDAQHSGHFGRRGFPGPSCPSEVGQAASPSGSPDPSPHRSLEVWGDGAPGTKTLVLPGRSLLRTYLGTHSHSHTPFAWKREPPTTSSASFQHGPHRNEDLTFRTGSPGPDWWRSRAGVALEPRASGSRPSDPSSRGARRSGPPPSPESPARPRSTRKPTRK